MPLVNYEGKVARACQVLFSIKLWILEDVDKEKWSCKDFYMPFPPEDLIETFDYYINELSKQKRNYFLADTTEDSGEFIFYSLINNMVW